LTGVNRYYLYTEENVIWVGDVVQYPQSYSQILGINMEYHPFGGDVADLKALQDYLDSVTILINALKQTYGV